MQDQESVDPKQKEINYYKKRVQQLSSSYMGLEHQRVMLNKDLIQMSEGLKIISELQYIDSNIGENISSFLDQIAEIMNVRMKMDVTLILMPNNETSGFHPNYIKSFSGYPTEQIANTTIDLPDEFVRERRALLADENTSLTEVIEEIRSKLMMPFFILYPIHHDDVLFGYLYVGRREVLLREGSGLMPYHLNTVEAISGVIIALKNQIERNEVLEMLVKKRTRELAEEKERTDQLLLNILPYEISQELKTKGSSKPRDYDCVTVFFTDFKDFTLVSEGLSPQELVGKIDYYYSQFDKIVAMHGMEKIKTIGDSYMCACGLPIEDEQHAIKAAWAALEIREFITQEKRIRKEQGVPFFDIRIGIHSGPVVAGIVGIKKFAYDIWGDTVNVASRMESNGVAGKINISATTYELIKHQFHCTYRGAVDVKNKGKVDMYFLEGPISNAHSNNELHTTNQI